MYPILFNTEMVKAILEGRKTVTRRIIKGTKSTFDYLELYKNPDICSTNKWGEEVPKEIKGLYACFEADDSYFEDYPLFKSPFEVGDKLYVRETWSEWTGGYIYKAWTGPFPQAGQFEHTKWHPSIPMPKEAARIFLKVTNVRVERLQDITPKQAGNEGVSWETDNSGQFRRWQFHRLWDSTIKKNDLDRYGWEANPWVWVIEFERIESEV